MTMNLNTQNGYTAFNQQFPMYNWILPIVPGRADPNIDNEILTTITSEGVTARALYLHIPFCDTICNFCTLSKGIGHEGEDRVEAYIDALICEIHLKSELGDLNGVEISAIFFGGGTPSIMTAGQIKRVGAALHESFQLSRDVEFTFEVEVKSTSQEKLQAMRDIGVTNLRFGVQSMVPKYRSYFNLTATLESTRWLADSAMDIFDSVAVDFLYAMNGQTIDLLIEDLELVTDLGTTAVDCYPINNLITLPKMHKLMTEGDEKPLSMHEKMAYSILVREYMESNGYCLYNGHGFVKCDPPADHFMTRNYRNRYNEFLFGCHDMEIIGFGASASSYYRDKTFYNEVSPVIYGQKIREGIIPHSVHFHRPSFERGIAQGLPYQGRMRKSRIDMTRCDAGTISTLKSYIAAGLIEEDNEEWRLRSNAWKWYVNMMYTMTPSDQRKELDSFVSEKTNSGRYVDSLIGVLELSK